jgi:hypothetical protein
VQQSPPTIKSDFANVYIKNISSNDDLPWIQEIKDFFQS